MRFFYPLKKSWPVLDPHIELLRLLLASTRLVLGFTYESDGLIAHCDLTIEVQDMGPDKYRTGSNSTVTYLFVSQQAAVTESQS